MTSVEHLQQKYTALSHQDLFHIWLTFPIAWGRTRHKGESSGWQVGYWRKSMEKKRGFFDHITDLFRFKAILIRNSNQWKTRVRVQPIIQVINFFPSHEQDGCNVESTVFLNQFARGGLQQRWGSSKSSSSSLKEDEDWQFRSFITKASAILTNPTMISQSVQWALKL